MPYFKDQSICGWENDTATCEYLTSDGRKCAVGRWLKEPEKFRECDKGVRGLLMENTEDILKPEVQGVLNQYSWVRIQGIHDEIAKTPLLVDWEEIVIRIERLQREAGTPLPELLSFAQQKEKES